MNRGEKAQITIDSTVEGWYLYPQTPPGLSAEELALRQARIADQMAAFVCKSEVMFAQDRATIERIGGIKTTTLGYDVEVGYYVFREDVSVDLSNVTETVLLTPQEALSLLSWLQQEKPILEQLAKEQAQQSPANQ